MRRRWFCLAVRPGLDMTDFISKVATVECPVYPWGTSTQPAAMTLCTSRSRRIRCAALGNAVVPCCVRYAFLTLIRGAATTKPWRPKPQRRRWPANGWCVRDAATGDVCVQEWTAQLPLEFPLDMRLTFDPSVYRTDKPRSKLQTTSLVPHPVSSRRWTTPRHGNVGAANVLTQRNIRDLATQVRFERGTPEDRRKGHLAPLFLEWVMGYPLCWTTCPANETVHSNSKQGKHGRSDAGCDGLGLGLRPAIAGRDG